MQPDSQNKTGDAIRARFLTFFEERGHTVVPSAPLVPANDPTLLFTNAGMVPFKEVFTGADIRPYSRATSAQKCLRVSGKHNDLETVGRTARHHTFFEMLGNFSFGDYFKKEAIAYGWEFLTQEIGLPVDKLIVTVFRDDDEAEKIWLDNIGLPKERIIRLGEKDNFWSMGNTGPCGPCSEIHYDRGAEHACDNPDCGPDCECDRWLEIWNLVFMQYDRDGAGNLHPLPKPSVDTGMGLERLVSIVQKAPTNFETDLILPIIRAMERVTTIAYGATPETDVSFRVIGDHIRAAVFLVADDVHPSNEGRGYVLRRIVRRALRHGRMLGATEPFAHKLTGSVIDLMRAAYPELEEYRTIVDQVILGEERSFGATLDFGMKLIAELIGAAKERGDNAISGADAFRLYDTYGFPGDLAREIAEEAGVTIDREGFEKEMTAQQEKARQSWKGATDTGVTIDLADIAQTSFIGYDTPEHASSLLAIIKAHSRVTAAVAGESVALVLDVTPFYAESGGQVADTGVIFFDTFRALVTDVKKVGAHFLHHVTITDGSIRTGDGVTARIDIKRRQKIRKNHSATHLLQAALQQCLGRHVKQKGSEVTAEKLRFDYTHFTQPSKEEVTRVERMVNDEIMKNSGVATTIMTVDEATASGAMALFGEKYGEKVRVVSMGDFSRELCGGSHTTATGDIGLFKITSESSVAAGVRRIEGVTGLGALDYVEGRENEIAALAAFLKAPPGELTQRVGKQVDRIKELEKENRTLKEKLFSGAGGAADDTAVMDLNGIAVIAKELDGADAESMRAFVDDQKNRHSSVIVAVGAAAGEKALLTVGVTDDLCKTYPAGKIIKAMAAIVGGGGGGRPDMAQAGGKNPQSLPDAIAAVPGIIADLGK